MSNKSATTHQRILTLKHENKLIDIACEDYEGIYSTCAEPVSRADFREITSNVIKTAEFNALENVSVQERHGRVLTESQVYGTASGFASKVIGDPEAFGDAFNTERVNFESDKTAQGQIDLINETEAGMNQAEAIVESCDELNDDINMGALNRDTISLPNNKDETAEQEEQSFSK